MLKDSLLPTADPRVGSWEPAVPPLRRHELSGLIAGYGFTLHPEPASLPPVGHGQMLAKHDYSAELGGGGGGRMQIHQHSGLSLPSYPFPMPVEEAIEHEAP